MENDNLDAVSDLSPQNLRDPAQRNPEQTQYISGGTLDDQDIATVTLFHNVQLQQIRPILEACQVITLRDDEILIEPGQENHSLYFLLSGGLKVYLIDSGDLQINKKVGFTILPGECIGDMSIIEHKPVSAYVVSDGGCRLLVLPEHIFWDSLVQIPGIVRNLLSGLSSRIRRLDEIALQNLERELKFEYLQRELSAASRIQVNILPHTVGLFPNHPQVEVAASITPAKEVGGDFFDAFVIDQNHIVIAIGDVSGKGIPAALFMVRVITLLRLSISNLSPLGEIMESINRHLCENNDNCMFVTMFVGIFEVTSGKLIYVSGGHNWPFFARKDQAFNLQRVPNCMLLGVYEEACYQIVELTLEPGDKLFLYTDGVTEAENEERSFFSVERTGDVLNGLPKTNTAQDIVDAIQIAVAEFSAAVPQSDDITLLVLHYLGAS